MADDHHGSPDADELEQLIPPLRWSLPHASTLPPGTVLDQVPRDHIIGSHIGRTLRWNGGDPMPREDGPSGSPSRSKASALSPGAHAIGEQQRFSRWSIDVIGGFRRGCARPAAAAGRSIIAGCAMLSA